MSAHLWHVPGIIALAALLGWPTAALLAHELRPAYLEIVERVPEQYDLLFKVPAAGEDLRLGLHLQLPADVERVGTIRGEFTGRAHVQRMRVRRPGGLDGATIAVDGLAATLTDVLVRIQRLDGASQTLRLSPAEPSFVVAPAPGQAAIALTYAGLGIEHILYGFDHLLFVLALLILVGGWRRLVWTITAFTIAHSITLAAATLGWITVPPRPVEAVIALSIVFVAGEIIRAGRGQSGLGQQLPWLVAFVFGLLHGFGFASALGEIGLPGEQIPLALLAFNLGVEGGQLLFVALALSVASLLQLAAWGIPAWWRTVAAYGIGTLGMFWVIERVAAF
jgi:hypothetical protein